MDNSGQNSGKLWGNQRRPRENTMFTKIWRSQRHQILDLEYNGQKGMPVAKSECGRASHKLVAVQQPPEAAAPHIAALLALPQRLHCTDNKMIKPLIYLETADIEKSFSQEEKDKIVDPSNAVKISNSKVVEYKNNTLEVLSHFFSFTILINKITMFVPWCFGN